MHSVIQPKPVSARKLPVAENYRVEARERLGDGVDERTLELAALQLFENTALAEKGSPSPAGKPQRQVFDLTRTLESLHSYTAAVAAGPLNGPAVAALSRFSPGLLWEPKADQHRLKILGEPAVLDKVATELAPRFSVSFPDHEVWVIGNVRPDQREMIAGTLEQLHACIGNEAFRQLERVHVRPYIGQAGERGGEISGLASMNTPEVIFIKASQMEDRDKFAGTLFHEFGHLRDARQAGLWSQGYASMTPGSPFGSGGPFDFVSDYATTKPVEDLAETHRFLIQNWDKIQAEPQLWIHANGELGDKLAWVLDEFYGRSVEPLGQNMKDSMKAVKRGRSPFDNFEDFQEKLQALLKGEAIEATPEQRGYLEALRACKDTPARPWWKFC